VLADISHEGADALTVIIGHGNAETYSLEGNALIAADDHSGDVACCIAAVLGPDGFPRPELDLEAMGTRIGHIDRLWLEPPVRGRGLGLAVLRACTEAISPACVAVIIHPAPTEPDAMTDAAFELARNKLYAYWQRAGFLPLPDDPHHLVHDPSPVLDEQVAGGGTAGAWLD
jgi:hypothetical protein